MMSEVETLECDGCFKAVSASEIPNHLIQDGITYCPECYENEAVAYFENRTLDALGL